MAITLLEAREACQDKLTQYVIDQFRKSALLDMLPFDNNVKPDGSTSMLYAYNRTTTQPTAGVRAINAEYVAQEAKTTRYTTEMKILGGSFEIDRAIINNQKGVIDHVTYQMNEKIKATIALFHDLFINGDNGANPNEFDGLNKAITGSATEIVPTAAINLSTSANITTNAPVLLDTIRKLMSELSATPDVMLLNSQMYAVFQSIMDRAGMVTSKENFGTEVFKWGDTAVMKMGDKPGTSNPIIPIVNGETSIYFAKLGMDAVHAISPTQMINTYLPNMNETGAVKKGEVELIGAMVMKNQFSAGAIRKIKIA
ncbi:MAG TPA: hypothetical protein PKN54_03115 [Candidatus Cloacimonas acidaminovorans]|nr:hypothetical protein [Candidatus Cloacimonas acidaminovorans]